MQEKLCKQRPECILKILQGRDKKPAISNWERRSITSDRFGQLCLKTNTEVNDMELTSIHNCCLPLCRWYVLANLPQFQKL